MHTTSNKNSLCNKGAEHGSWQNKCDAEAKFLFGKLSGQGEDACEDASTDVQSTVSVCADAYNLACMVCTPLYIASCRVDSPATQVVNQSNRSCCQWGRRFLYAGVVLFHPLGVSPGFVPECLASLLLRLRCGHVLESLSWTAALHISEQKGKRRNVKLLDERRMLGHKRTHTHTAQRHRRKGKRRSA
eukprot:3352107-Amphidinium_carterae.1